jgi:hypothetical protein
MNERKKVRRQSFAAAVGRALRRACVTARQIEHMHETPVYAWKNRRIVAEKP